VYHAEIFTAENAEKKNIKCLRTNYLPNSPVKMVNLKTNYPFILSGSLLLLRDLCGCFYY